MKFLSELKRKNLSNQTCLLRVDFNIEDADLRGLKRGLTRIPFRIKAALPTIKFLLKRGAKVVILSHRGRPAISDKRQETRGKKKFSLKPFARILSQLLKKPVRFIDFKKGLDISKIRKTITITRDSVFLLENLRFFPGEDKNDQKFAKNLASLGTFYINDAFAFSHRPTASIVGIPKFLPSYAGLLLEKEIKNLSMLMKNHKKPLVVILGGIKVSDKIGFIRNFLKKADKFLVGGGVANTFFAAEKLPVDGSLYEKNMIPLARQLLKAEREKIILPIDSVIEKRKILDIGPKTSKKYVEIIKKARTVVWNGPMGYIENPKFARGSKAVAQAVLKSRAFSVVGGGETISILPAACFKLHASRLFISTGGGAMLEYLAGEKLPGLSVLNNHE